MSSSIRTITASILFVIGFAGVSNAISTVESGSAASVSSAVVRPADLTWG
ncbi:hypothetical protein KGA66_13800 [Actinocrinis puniceicyclus]|uniref:Uncharacterized protein n=1 Tax=Actinocrinis puniceicyclus TaxID=977794 RepID=A0A8J7WQJ6_9ACTN|nr:hypothetical protein [Actinocrinis puniceicyclus]MBS2964127.1 hypothetical protein [Actinocrinis puniceicyclus]